jgi:pyrroloquinoline quinone (PQQ) biosynthesis protein C
VNYLQQHITTDYGDKEEAAEMIAEIMAGSHVKALSAGTQQKLKGFLKKLEYAEEWYELKVTEGTLLVGAQDD